MQTGGKIQTADYRLFKCTSHVYVVLFPLSVYIAVNRVIEYHSMWFDLK